MSVKLNVGLSRKVGEQDYGSRGASVQLELELDESEIGDPERLRDQIRYLFRLAKSSINEELGSRDPPGAPDENGRSRAAPGNSNGRARGRSATQSQVRAIHAIARQRQIDLSRILQERHQVDRPDDLSLRDASALIDELKGEAEASRR